MEQKGSFSKPAFFVGATAVILAALAYKNKDKLQQRFLKKLEDKGYYIYTPEDIERATVVVCDDEL